LEDRKRELQRVEKPRLRTRTQFRPWPEVSRDDAGGPQSARLRLAHRARTARTALASRPRSRGQANQLLRPHPHVERLRNLSLLAGFPPIPRHLLDPAGPHKSRRQSVNVEKLDGLRHPTLENEINDGDRQRGEHRRRQIARITYAEGVVDLR